MSWTSVRSNIMVIAFSGGGRYMYYDSERGSGTSRKNNDGDIIDNYYYWHRIFLGRNVLQYNVTHSVI